MAVNFNGADQYVYADEAFTTNAGDGDQTLAFFVRPQTLTAAGYPAAVNESVGSFEFLAARMEPTSDVAGRHKTASSIITAYSTLPNDAWSPVVITFESATGTVTIYPGTTTGTSASGSPNTITWDRLTIGAALGTGTTPADFFKGKVARPMYLERKWSAAEISAFINATTPADIDAIDTTALVFRYDLISDLNADGAGVGLTAANAPTFDADDPLSPSLAITDIDGDDIFADGDQDISVTGTALDTVTSVILQTDDGTYVDDITAGFFASSATAATIDHDRLLTPLSSGSYQLQLIFSDDATPTPNAVSVNITITPATGYQVVELAGTLILTDPESAFAPYTGPDPVVGDQYIVPLVTTEGAPITANADSTLEYDYTSIDPVPATDGHGIEWWSSNGSARVWSSGSISISEPDTESPYVTSVSVPAAGTLVPGNNLDLTVNLDEVANVTTSGGTPRIPLTIGAATRYASYVSGTGTAAHLYRYVVQAGDLDEDGIAVGAAVDLNGGVIQDGAGNDLDPALNNIGDTSGVLVDGVGPAITISSITTTDTTPVVSGSAGDAVSLTLVVNGVTYNPVPSGGSWSQQLPELPLGDYPMTLDGEDAVGNAAVQRQATLSVVDEIPSTATSVLRPVLLPILSPVLEVSL